MDTTTVTGRRVAARRTGDIESDAILAVMTEGVVVHDDSGAIVRTNPAAETLLGFDAGGLIGMNLERWRVVRPDLTPWPARDFPAMQVLASGEPVRNATMGVYRPDGSLRWLDVNAVPAVVDDQGRVVRVVTAFVDVTARVLSEAQAVDGLRHVDRLLQAASSHSIIATTLDGSITTFNLGAEKMFGYRAEEMIGRSPAMLHEPHEVVLRARELGVDVGLEVFHHAARRGAVETRNWTLIRSDGRRIIAELTVQGIRNGDGELEGYVGIATDVTAEVRARKELDAQAERWRRLLDELPEMAVLEAEEGDDGQYRFIEVRGKSLAAHGYPDLTGMLVADWASTINRDAVMQACQSAFEGIPQSDLLEHPDGWWLDATVLPLAAVEDRRRVMVVVHDVTREQERERALATAEERFRRMFAEAPSGNLVFDLQGRIISVNRALCEILEMDEQELVGRTVTDVSAALGCDLSPLHNATKRTAETGRARGELTLNPGTQIEMHVEFETVALVDSRGAHQEVLVNLTDISERRKFEEQLAHQADHDPLTDLYNRRRFERELRAHMVRGERYGHRGAVILLDLDNFKRVNDTLGHGAGDELILSVAGVLRKRLRSSDIVARLGGDEFAILMPSGGRPAAEQLAEKLVVAIREEVTVGDRSRSRRISASLGVVLINKAGLTPVELMKQADLAMYDSKEAGRDSYTLLDLNEASRTKSAAHTAWADRIEAALDENRFVLHAQPIVDLHTGVVESAELLIRMLDDNGSLIPPSRFLYIAERLGLITEIDRWVIGEAVGLLKTVQAVAPQFRLEVNLSGKSIGSANLSSFIRNAVAEAEVDPSGLVLEITETAAVSDIQSARQFAEELQQAGCRFALDDFGAGFGGFYYLKHLPFDFLKIDGEFVVNCATTPTDQLILTSIVDIARGMKKETIAEFVGDKITLDTIRRAGVDHAQGYFIGAPVPLSELVPMARLELD